MSVKRRTSYPVILEQIEPKHTNNPPETPQTKSSGKRGRPKGRKNRNRRDVVLTPYLRFVQETINSLLKLIVDHVDKTPCGRTWGMSVGLQGPDRCAVEA